MTETWDHLKRVFLFPGGSLCESHSVVSDQSLSGSSVHGIPQARILQWVAILFSGESSPGTEPGSTALKAGSLNHQGNSNQQKGVWGWGGSHLPIYKAWVPVVGSEKSVWFLCSVVSDWPSSLRLKKPIVVLWILGFSLVSQLEKNSPTVRETWVRSLG